VELLREAARAGCEWLDVEVETWRELSGREREELRGAAKVMVSYHDFKGGTRAIAKLPGVMRELRKRGGDLFKVAVKVGSVSDSVRVLDLARGRRDVVAVPMGEEGAGARILALRAGSALAYGAVEQSTAPGQISFEEMKNLYRADRLDRRTRVYGVIGDPVGHSLSPQMQNAAFQARGMNCVYVPFLVRNLRDFLAAACGLGVAGLSVTIPHKEAILKYLDECDKLSERVGAVNTVVMRRGRMEGYNTDCVGVLKGLETRGGVREKRVLIVGAGGAARAAAIACVDAGAEVLICARRAQRARQLARDAGASAIARGDVARQKFDVIVNATPMGMQGSSASVGQSPLEARELNCELVFDLVYRPMRTKLLRMAERRGIATLSGVEMFIAQGAAQWEIWTGERAPLRAMRKAVMKVLKAEK
jgi:3-dehydroquinate dehydratase / shikimate dehydrogenase